MFGAVPILKVVARHLLSVQKAYKYDPAAVAAKESFMVPFGAFALATAAVTPLFFISCQMIA